ncbi:hypothetical protein WMY93_027228 [Mugilogobius chulae]|uniref:Vacuolar protein sorting 13 homolog D n=1 Tax=Mugilogobius chulae TaxID=88201 RepID=A0AAW0N192_9GOBI
MLEGLVAWVLNTYLGKYVSNLNTDQLSIALLKGAVELENLPLRKDALREFDLPFEVKAGFIGKITLQIPFYKPHSEPWVISMSQLNLIIGPSPLQEYDAQAEAEEERERKRRLLQALEDKFRGESYWYSVTASVVTRIVENIELKIQDVHLRFEDDFSDPDKPFSFGVCINNVYAQNPSKETGKKQMRQKQLEIEDFSVYWDSQSTMLGQLPINQIQEAMTACMQSREHQYMFEPVWASVRLRRNTSKEPLRSRHTPRIEGMIQLEPLSLRLSQVQYQQMMMFLKELDRRERELRYRRWRPKVPVTNNCRTWWSFAIQANLQEIREQRHRCNWDFALQRARDAQTYTSLYFRKLKGVALSPQEEEELERVEEEQTVDELQILREVVHDWFRKQQEIAENVREPSTDPQLPETTCSLPKSGSSGMVQYLQSWFPGWGGWYGESQDPAAEHLLPSPSSWDLLAETEDLFDPMEDSHTLNTFTRRDNLFARLEFQLEKGSVTLYHEERGEKEAQPVQESGVIQLELSEVKVILESLPRSESSLLSVKLGGLFLRDLSTQGTIFPVLVSPKTDKVFVTMNQSPASGQTISSTGGSAQSSSSPVFEMIYERNPVRSTFERRLEVHTSPLNIIYNPQAIKKVTEFFYKGRVHTSGFGYQSELELRVAEAARRQYNKLKMQTKAEIRQTIDQLLVGEFIENSKRWTMKLDISAPQVIFPDNFQSEDPMLVVVDLGRILLTNSQVPDSLATPPESPPPELNLPSKEPLKSPEIPSLRSPENVLACRKKLYEKYSLSFKDLQIMVGHCKDNWKHLQESEVGPTHVVEKFNVLLQLEQRLRYTSDPQLPGAVLSGTLPDLKVHINFEKMSALRSCLARLGGSTDKERSSSEKNTNPKPADPFRHQNIFKRDNSSWKLHGSTKNLTQSVMTLEQHTREVLVESRLLLAEFNINYMQLGVESEGRYISVLKVFGTNAHFVKRPYDTEVSLTVHGLLLVDTLQTYGSDFDLLVASHKHLSFDIPTGSLRESQPSSPISDQEKVQVEQGLQKELSTGAALDSAFLKDQNALIKLEYQFVSSDCPSMNLDSSLQVTTMQVNNLDIILNPETMVELLKFLQKSFPKEENDLVSTTNQSSTSDEENGTYQVTYDQNTELTVEIQRLNVLLLRTVSTGCVLGAEKKCLKIATASIAGTKVNVSLGSRMDVHGSLGSLQLVDLTHDSVQSQFVVSIGNVEDCSDTDGAALLSEMASAPCQALNFHFLEKSQGECLLQLEMASLHYNHSPKFLKELSLSANEVEDNFRSMLKSAASKVSTVLATKTAEYSGMVSLFETPSRRTRTQSQCWGFPFDETEEDLLEESQSSIDTFLVKLTLNIEIESPVVSIPRKPGHTELLVGHLGRISIQNIVTGQGCEEEQLQVLVRDIRLYSLNLSHLDLKKKHTDKEAASDLGESFSTVQFTRHDFFESLTRGKAYHILKDTTIQFTMEKVPVEEDSHVAFLSTEEPCRSSGLLKVQGKFITPVQHATSPFPQRTRGYVCPDPPHISFSSPLSLQAHEPKPDESAFTQLKITLHVPELQVQLNTDLTQGSQGLVSLCFHDLEGDISKDHPQLLAVQLALRSLLMEDLLEHNPESKYKHLMVSRGAPKPSTFTAREYLSQSCPSVSNVQYPDMPRSLPAHIEAAQNVFQHYQRHPSTPSASRSKAKEEPDCPSTPPPSPTHRTASQRGADFDDSLVHINILLVDQAHPEFRTRYGGVGRSVDVDFNCLDVLITLQTWVVILDFFGIGSTANNHAVKITATSPQPVCETYAEDKEGQAVNTKVDLKVRDQPQRGSRVLLDIEAGAPVIVIPESSRSPRVIVLNLGQLKVQNRFLPAGAHGTFSLRDKERLQKAADRSSDEEKTRSVISAPSGFCLGRPHAAGSELGSEEVPEEHVCLLDCIALDLEEMDIFAAARLPSDGCGKAAESSDLVFPSYLVRRTGANMLKDCCRLKLKVERNLDRFDFMKSKLLFESFSNGSKSVNLVSHSLLAFDTRGSDPHAHTRDGYKHNVFDCILQPSKTGSNRASLQLELHYRSTKDSSSFTVVLNNLRVFLIFDWLLLVQDFLRMPAEKNPGGTQTRQRWPSNTSTDSGSSVTMPKTVKSGVVTKRSTVPVSQDRCLEVKINVTGTEFVVVEDSSCLDTNAIILKGTTVLTYKPRLLDRPFSGSLAGIEVFSCRLGSEQETALSIIDPVNVQVELCGSPTYQSSSGLLDAFNVEDIPPLLELDQAATWLLENAENMSRARADSSSGHGTPLSGWRLYILQRIGSTQEGTASFALSGDYYNRELSGWEPFVEPWPCFLSWQQQAAGRLHPPRLKMAVRAKQRLDINITSVLMEQYNTTKSSWMADYCKEEEQSPQSPVSLPWVGSSVDPPCFDKSAPLAHLRTRSTASLSYLEQHRDVKLSKRRQPFVPYALRNHTGCTLWFATLTTSPTRVALSHSSSADSISEVHGPGADDPHSVSQWKEVLPGAELPFEFEAREKLRHRHTHELKLHQLLVRVCGWEQIKPVSVDKVGVFFRYAAPDRNSSSNTVGSPVSRTNIIHPHVYFSALPPVRVVFAITMEGSARKVITVRSALMVKNRLDVPMEVRLDSPSAPDKPVVLPPILPTEALAIPLHLTHGVCRHGPKAWACSFVKSPSTGPILRGHQKRKLPRPTAAKRVSGGPQQIYRQPGHTVYLLPTMVLVNLLPCDLNFYIKSLPLIFRQDNGKTDAAGQFEEHELARSLSPLLFCYTDKEQPAMCTMRIGKGIHPDGVPGWCQGFSLDGGSGVRAVKVIQHGNRPGLIYNIGISVRKGKGRYRDTHIVTFAPRYLLDNRSSHKLAFAQREFARGKGTVNPDGYISTLPGSSVVFHWPRNDYDQLLCVRLMDTPNCTWSGGFEINKNKSFHINMRDTLGSCFFLRTEISLKGATYQISFNDTDQLPPPFRIQNISEVPIQFWQHGVADMKLRTEVKAGAVLDYACDEPTLSPYLSLTVKGAGSSEVTADMNFFRSTTSSTTRTSSTSQPLTPSHRAGEALSALEMTGTGMLCHEGSSPPQSKPAQPRPLDSSLVLDIAGLAAVSDNSYEPLMLRRPDSRRSTTQTWYFSSGMLTCGLLRLVVQVKGGVAGLYDGAEVVLGPDSGLQAPSPEQQFINQKMRPGSGVLSVQVLPDGPTRVLQISDNLRRSMSGSPTTELEADKEEKPKEMEQELEVLVNLDDGVGVSLVNRVPEELVFTTLSGINVHFTRTAANEVLELNIQSIQVDNQLLGTTHPVMLCVSPSSGDSSAADTGDALQVNSVKVPSTLQLTQLFKHLMVTTRRFTVIVEEKLLLKLLHFFGFGETEAELERLDENIHERPSENAGQPKRYYFENLKISLPQIKLSVFTSHKLPPDLKALKGTLGFPLIRFEDAVINMYPFTRVHPYETQEIIINDILKHFREVRLAKESKTKASVTKNSPANMLDFKIDLLTEIIHLLIVKMLNLLIDY